MKLNLHILSFLLFSSIPLMALADYLSELDLEATGEIEKKISNSHLSKEQKRTAKEEKLLARINKIVKDPAKKAKAIRLGKDRALLCSKCHGKDGNSNNPGIPRLAGQNVLYLLDQIEKFASGERKQFVMNQLAKTFTDRDKTILAIYYSNSKVKPAKGNPVKALKGKQYYNNVCINCHGADGKGKKGYARIAGQRPDYIIKTLKHFREKSPNRKSQKMEQFAGALSDEMIENLAAYIANLR